MCCQRDAARCQQPAGALIDNIMCFRSSILAMVVSCVSAISGGHPNIAEISPKHCTVLLLRRADMLPSRRSQMPATRRERFHVCLRMVLNCSTRVLQYAQLSIDICAGVCRHLPVKEQCSQIAVARSLWFPCGVVAASCLCSFVITQADASNLHGCDFHANAGETTTFKSRLKCPVVCGFQADGSGLQHLILSCNGQVACTRV